MAITITSNKPDGVLRYEYGRYLDDVVTPAAKTFTLGFAPSKIRWVNLTDSIEWEWFKGMANGTTQKTVAAGTRTLNTADVAVSVSSANVVTVAAAVILQNKQYTYVIEG